MTARDYLRRYGKERYIQRINKTALKKVKSILKKGDEDDRIQVLSRLLYVWHKSLDIERDFFFAYGDEILEKGVKK